MLETNIVKSNDSDKIKAFRKILDIQNFKKNESNERQKVEDEYRAIEEEETKQYEQKLIAFEN